MKHKNKNESFTATVLSTDFNLMTINVHFYKCLQYEIVGTHFYKNFHFSSRYYNSHVYIDGKQNWLRITPVRLFLPSHETHFNPAPKKKKEKKMPLFYPRRVEYITSLGVWE